MEWLLLIFVILTLAAYGLCLVATWMAIQGREGASRVAAFAGWGGLCLHSMAIALKISSALAAGILPLTGMHSAGLVISWAAVAFILISQLRYEIFFSLLYVLPVALAVLLLGLLVGDLKTPPSLQEAGANILFPVHITFLYSSMGVLLAAVCLSLVYLRQQRALQQKPLSNAHLRMPALANLDRAHSLAMRVGFGLLLLGIVSGLRLAHNKWEGTWSRDPAVLFSLLTVSWYGAMLLVRQLWGLRGRKAAYLTMIGFFLLIFTFVGIVFWFPKGKHPYIEKPAKEAEKSSTLLMPQSDELGGGGVG